MQENPLFVATSNGTLSYFLEVDHARTKANENDEQTIKIHIINGAFNYKKHILKLRKKHKKLIDTQIKIFYPFCYKVKVKKPDKRQWKSSNSFIHFLESSLMTQSQIFILECKQNIVR